MPLDLSSTLVVGISSTALFDLNEADQLFRELRKDDPDKAIERYRDYMQERENKPLDPGTGLPLVKALLQLNEHTPGGEPPITEVVVMSRNSPETGVRVLNSIRDRMQDRLPTRVEYSPVRLALVTSRDSPADLRVINTLRAWGVYVDLAFFLGGVDKGPVLEAFNPHIFFDDQDVHVESAAERVPTGKVLYCSDSKLRDLQEERAQRNGSGSP